MNTSAPVQGLPVLDLATWRTTIDRSFVPLQVDEYGGVPFAGCLRTSTFEDVSLFEIISTAHVVRRTPQLIQRVEGRYYKLSLQLSGAAVLEQDGRRAEIRPGDLAVYDTHRPYMLTFPVATHCLVLMFPHEYVDLPRREVADVTAIRFAHDESLPGIVSRFFVDLASNLDDLTGPHGARLVRSSIDVLVTLLSARLHNARSAPAARNAPRNDLVRRVRHYIQDHLADPQLSPAGIAEAHYVSTRHLHAVFAEEELTVAALIRIRRLERIRRDLGDPLRRDQAVSSIAAGWGLRDAAHFSKMYRAQYGESPTAYRSRVLGTERPAPPRRLMSARVRQLPRGRSRGIAELS